MPQEAATKQPTHGLRHNSPPASSTTSCIPDPCTTRGALSELDFSVATGSIGMDVEAITVVGLDLIYAGVVLGSFFWGREELFWCQRDAQRHAVSKCFLRSCFVTQISYVLSFRMRYALVLLFFKLHES